MTTEDERKAKYKQFQLDLAEKLGNSHFEDTFLTIKNDPVLAAQEWANDRCVAHGGSPEEYKACYKGITTKEAEMVWKEIKETAAQERAKWRANL